MGKGKGKSRSGADGGGEGDELAEGGDLEEVEAAAAAVRVSESCATLPCKVSVFHLSFDSNAIDLTEIQVDVGQSPFSLAQCPAF